MEVKVDSANFLSAFDEAVAKNAGDWVSEVFEAIDPLLAHLLGVIDPITAAAFLAGAVAAMTGARLALLGAVMLVLAELAVASEILAGVPTWTAPAAIALLLLGAVQGVLTLVVGEQTAGTLLAAAIVGTIFFILWRGPARALRILGAVAHRMARR
ncbi:hypothetical protein [Antarctobacter jejuensis]|uniref:hypothetical protein n=1 Tax=Antarctobacter jejuensis TaxID=1439938 RepID=UPI003FD61892